jgi:hypothetical protein
MLKWLLRIPLAWPAAVSAIALTTMALPLDATAEEPSSASQIRKEVWALPLALPILAYMCIPNKRRTA